MKITKRTAIGVTLIVLIGLTSWALAGTLTEQQYIDAGKAEYHRGNYESAIYLFTKGLELNPDNHYIYNDRGLCYLAVGDTDKAISDFSEAIVLEPDFAKAYYNRGLAYFEAKEYENAIANYTTAIGLLDDPDKLIDAYYNRGLAYNKLFHYHSKPFTPEHNESYRKALADFDTVLELDPEYALAYAAKGNAYYRYGEFDNATAEFNTALNSTYIILLKAGDPGLAEVYYSKARTLKQMPEQAYEAISAFEKAREVGLDPEWERRSFTHQAPVHKRLGEYNKALQIYNEVTELPRFKVETGWVISSVYFNRGTCYYVLEEYDAAISDFNRVLNKTPFEAHGHKYLGIIYSKIGDDARAKHEFEKAVELYSAEVAAGEGKTGAWQRFELMKAHSNRGLCYLCLGEYNKAISDLEKALESEQNHVEPHEGEHYYLEAYKNLGAYYSEIGEKEMARDYFEAGLRLAKEQCVDKMKVVKEIEDLLGEL